MKQRALTIIGLLLILTGCGNTTWDGFVYPSKDDLFRYDNIGEFKTLEACKKACQDKLEELKASDRGYWQCGKNCVDDRGAKNVQSCKEVVH